MFGFFYRNQDVVREFPQKNPVYLSRILADMVDKGILCKIARNNCHIIPYNADLEWTTDHEKMMEELGPGISLLDPAAPDQGRKRSKFGLKINVEPIRIKKKVLHRKMS